MKISVITVCFNAVQHIDETLRSVVVQDHDDIEHIVIDGGSTDGTQQKILRYRELIAHYVSEPDRGVYDAMNKGLKVTTGDVVVFVNAGDMIANRDCLSYMSRAFTNGDEDAIYGDAYMVDPEDIRILKRFWKGEPYDREKFRKGWMPPHLGTYIRRGVYERFGHFREDLEVSADYELLLRFMYVHRIKVRYVEKVLVRFRLGGMSNRSLLHVLCANLEVYKAWRLNGLRVSPLIILRKPLRKVLQYFQR